MKRCWLGLLYLLLAGGVCLGQGKYSVDSGECDETTVTAMTSSKTHVYAGPTARLKMYGVLEYRHNAADAKRGHCHVVYRLMLSSEAVVYREVYKLEWDAEPGEIAGIDLIGASPDGTKVAASFWLAEGDGQTNRVVVFDLHTNAALFAEMPAVGDIRKRTDTCDDAPFAVLESVTNTGAIIVSVPAYEGCGDGGLWSFDPVKRAWTLLRRVSGHKMPA